MRLVALSICALVLASCSQPAPYALPLSATTSHGSARPLANHRYEVLYKFGGSADGAYPSAGLVAYDGELYGTTEGGGPNNDGTVFDIGATGDESVLFSFDGSDGAKPESSLVELQTGGRLVPDLPVAALFGTTSAGGSNGNGTIFKLYLNGKGAVLYNFGKAHDGQHPQSALRWVQVVGAFYGTTERGGAHDAGTVYRYYPRNGKERVLHSFGTPADGKLPRSPLAESSNAHLYGTTDGGGLDAGGTAFDVSSGGSFHSLHSFGSGADGKSPDAPLVGAGTSTFYGTTCNGGQYGDGTVFFLEGRSERVVYNFGAAAHDGKCPTGGLIDYDGVLYGTTIAGGSAGKGTVFELSLTGGESVLHSFRGGSDGEVPTGDLVQLDSSSPLYGTTSRGGNGFGTVFAVNPIK